MAEALYIGNDNNLTLSGLRNAETGGYLNDAAVTATLTTMDGVAVPGQSWPAPLNYVADSQGCYRLVLSRALPLVNGRYYRLQVDAEGDSLRAKWQLIYKATARIA